MKTYTRILTALAGILLATSVSPASAQQDSLRSQIPFEFAVGDHALPRGAYEVDRMEGQNQVFLVRSMRGGAVILGQRVGDENGAKTPQLVFHRYGDRYFLREIRFSGRMAFSLPESRGERQAAERASAETVQRELVVVAAAFESGAK